MRRAFRLLPLPLGIAICLPAMADDKPVNWGLCPATESLPAFEEAPQADPKSAANREQLPTDIEGNELTGTTVVPEYQGNVVLKRAKDVMRGAQLTVNLATGQAALAGPRGTPGAPQGRVQGVFSPTQDQSQTQSQSPGTGR